MKKPQGFFREYRSGTLVENALLTITSWQLLNIIILTLGLVCCIWFDTTLKIYLFWASVSYTSFVLARDKPGIKGGWIVHKAGAVEYYRGGWHSSANGGICRSTLFNEDKNGKNGVRLSHTLPNNNMFHPSFWNETFFG